jgi:two-component system, NarL family, sensor kinase
MKPSARTSPSRELARLRVRLAEAEETLRAIRTGEVDAVVVAGKAGRQVFTLQGAEQAYRILIESMNEGALTVTAGKMILYANKCLARMLKCPLEQVTGSSFDRFLSVADQARLKPLLQRATRSGSKIQMQLNAGDGSQLPVHISIRPLLRHGSEPVAIGMVVTDMTETRRAEELLRALTHRVVQVQETERGRVALELHDNITQLLCAVLIRSQTLADGLPLREGASRSEALKLREMLGHAADEVERISRNLRPGVLEHLGLIAVLRDSSAQFSDRTGVAVKLACLRLKERLPADIELALYRIFQETLKNVEKHAHAHQVKVGLRLQGGFIRLLIEDDGVGFDPDTHPSRRKGKGGLGLLSMRERAAYVDGILTIKSRRHIGTEIEVRIAQPAKTKTTR